MNLLILGKTDKTAAIQEHLSEPFLLIDDGPIIDALPRPKRRKHTELDFSIHSFNPLRGMTYRKARDFIDVLDAVFPEGANTLTKKNANYIILKSLVENKTGTINQLLGPSSDAAQNDAYQKLQTLLLSPVLERVLERPNNFSFDQTLYARLDRATLGDFDCFVLASLLIAQFKGQVVIPDFGFYACKPLMSLIRQNRIIAGLHFLDEVPQFRNELLLMDAIGQRCIHEDAETLAEHAGLLRDTVGFSDLVHKLMA